MTKLDCCLIVLAVAAPALAADKPAPSGATPDMTKMGPLSRPVTKEDKKGVEALFKSMDEAWKKGDIEALAVNIDFPVIMLSDDSTGAAKHFNASREQWVALMKPFLNMPKDDMKMSHKDSVSFLSDTLAVAIQEHTMTGKMKGKFKSMCVLTQKDGGWKIKEMAEAGWGDMEPPRASGPSRTPTNITP